MAESRNEQIFNAIRKLVSIDYIDPDEIPKIDLYMDQVTTFMDSHLTDSKRSEDDKILTKTMINNYTKNNLLPPPIRKKYSKDHLYLLTFIYYLKNMFSINDIDEIISPLIEMFYDGKSNISLEDIYRSIVEQESGRSSEVMQEIIKCFKNSKNFFKDKEIENEKELDYLQQFSFICMLSYDIYMRKSMLNRMIDDILSPEHKEKE